MKFITRLLLVLLFACGFVTLIYLSLDNNRLRAGLDQLEAELGRMSIEDADRIHIVEIEEPDVPVEVAAHLQGTWQFRCYLPPNYDFMQLSGDGHVTKEGVYQDGGYSSSWGTPTPQAIHKLLTVSIQQRGNNLEVFHSFSGSSGTNTWSETSPTRFDALVVQKLVSSDRGPRTFDRDTILPLLKIYDPSTAQSKEIAGKTLTTYVGGLIVLCPKSRERALNQLRSGQTPSDFDPSWIATEVVDE